MARKNPLSDREKEICGRLRTFRSEVKVSMVAFAQALGISSPKLASHEYGRVPIRYATARQAGQKFNLNLAWLCYGIGPSIGYEPPLDKTESKIPANALLTEALDKFLPDAKKRQQLRDQGQKHGIKTSFMVQLGVPRDESEEYKIANAAGDASHGLPPELRGNFFWHIRKAANEFAKKHNLSLHGSFGRVRPPPHLE